MITRGPPAVLDLLFEGTVLKLDTLCGRVPEDLDCIFNLIFIFVFRTRVTGEFGNGQGSGTIRPENNDDKTKKVRDLTNV